MTADDPLAALLAEPARSLQAIIEAAPMAMIIVGRHGRVYRWNRAAESILGWTAGEMQQQPNPIFSDSSAYQEVWEGRNVTLPEHAVVDKFGEPLYLRVALAPLFGSNGQPVAAIIMADDITQRALNRQLLERRVGDRTRKLSTLYDVMTIAAATTDEEALLQAVLTRVVSATEAGGGMVALRAGGELIAQARCNLPTVTAETDLLQLMAESEELLVIENASRDQRVPHGLRGDVVCGIICTPLLTKQGKMLGALCLFRAHKRRFGRENVALVQSVADQIALTVESLRLRSRNDTLLLIEERNRLARELHDAVNQSLYSVMLMSGALERQLEQSRLESAQSTLVRLQEAAQQALKEMRLLIYNLRPSALAEGSLAEALQQRINAVEARAGLRVTFDAPEELALPPAVEETLYYIAQEALNNALKHSNANNVHVVLEKHGDQVSLLITDDGHGFDRKQALSSGGLGLTSISERAARAAGKFEITSAAEQGTTLRITLPLRNS